MFAGQTAGQMGRVLPQQNQQFSVLTFSGRFNVCVSVWGGGVTNLR